MVTYLLVSSRFFIKGWISNSWPSSLKSELIGESFSTRRLTDGQTKVETMSAMYDGIAQVHIPPSHGWMRKSSTDAPLTKPSAGARVHLKVAELHLPLHNKFTSEFLNRQDNSRDLLGKHTVPDRSKRRLLQKLVTNSNLPQVKLWSIRENDDCRLCKRLHSNVTPCPESLGHNGLIPGFQAWYPVLRKPRIAVHHGIWRKLLTAISRKSLETHDDGEKKWYERTVRQNLVHLGLFSGLRRLNEEIATFHARQHIFLTSEKITTFYGRRPDGVAFDTKGKQCFFLESTRPMDSVTSSDNGDWAERKELEKNERYGLHRYFINYLSALSGRPWNCLHGWSTLLSQENLISRKTSPSRADGFQSQKQNPNAYCVKNSSFVWLILKLFHVSILRSPEWALSSLSIG